MLDCSQYFMKIFNIMAQKLDQTNRMQIQTCISRDTKRIFFFFLVMV